jgi:hypothetical protein
MYRKEIVYDRETRDFAMYLDGELVGFARTYHEAEVELDRLVYDLLSHNTIQEGNDEKTALQPDRQSAGANHLDRRSGMASR